MTAVMYSAGLRIGEVCRLRYEDIDRKNMRIHICHSKSHTDRYAILSQTALELLTQYGLLMIDLWAGFFQSRHAGTIQTPLTPSISHAISVPMKSASDGNTAFPAILSDTLLAPIFIKTEQTCSPSNPCLDINL